METLRAKDGTNATALLLLLLPLMLLLLLLPIGKKRLGMLVVVVVVGAVAALAHTALIAHNPKSGPAALRRLRLMVLPSLRNDCECVCGGVCGVEGGVVMWWRLN